MEATIFLLNTSSIFIPSASNSLGALGTPREITLLDYRRIGCVLLLGEGRQGKGDCQYYEGTSKHVFIISSWGTAFIFGPFRLLYLKSWIPLESVSTI